MSPGVVVTGVGLVSAAGSNMADLTESLARGRHCLSPIRSFETAGMNAAYAGEVADFKPMDFLPPVRATTVDRGTQLAVAAATHAMAQAGFAPDIQAACGVAVGYSGSPQYQNMRVYPDRQYPVTRQVALYTARTTPNFQADLLARHFGLGGVRFAFSSASLGGLLALSHAMDLLRAEHAPAMLVGGGEINTLVNALGMDGLGVTGAGPCTPFTGASGISFGEGAAFFVLERRDDAEARGACILAELVCAGISADAYSDVAQDPSGRGLTRAVRKCLENGGIDPSRIGWVRSCGTGARDLDAAEAIALCAVFDNAPPPVTSTEPYFSHVNGVSPLLGLAAVLAAFASGSAPSMPETAGPARPGLALKLLAPGALPEGDCLLTATAFGGTNGAVIARSPNQRMASIQRATPQLEIVIAGMGAVSALGGTLESLLNGLVQPKMSQAGSALRVDDAWLRKNRAGLNVARRERLVRMAMLAVAEALDDAGIAVRGSERYGLLVGLSRGPLAAYERFFEHTLHGRFDATTGRALLRIGRFSVASEIAHSFDLLGYSGAMAPGVHGGVQLLAHGAELLRATPDLDGLLVVAADEWTGLLEKMYARLGLLGNGAAYDREASGCVGGEGAAAVLLVRRPAESHERGWARIIGAGFAGDIAAKPDPQGGAYQRAIATALHRAGREAGEIDFAIGQGCGWRSHDAREVSALRPVCAQAKLTSVLPQTGLAESAGGLFAAVAAASALRDGRLPALPPPRLHLPRLVHSAEAQGDFRHGVLIGSTERGAHAAVVLSRMAA
jgi:3-oxoacyl-[acyl-carrier-protein] synthase II